MTTARRLLDLPRECVACVLQECSRADVLRFCLVSRAARAAATADDVWRPLCADDVQLGAAASSGGWHAAYVAAARERRPLVVHFEAGTSHIGRDVGSGPVHFDTAKVPAADAMGLRNLHAIDVHAVAAAAGVSWRGAAVCLVVSPLDTCKQVQALLETLFATGATSAMVVDAAVGALNALGAHTGTVLHVGHDGVGAACVLHGRRLKLPEQRCWLGSGLNRAIAYLRERASLSSARDAELSWLLQRHCYVRVVSIERRPVSDEERELSEQRIELPGRHADAPAESPSNVEVEAEVRRHVVLREERFTALECLFSGGTLALVRAVVEANAREDWPALYGAVMVTGAGAGLPGLRARLETEMRTLRRLPEMPRALQPRVLAVGADGVPSPPPAAAAWHGAARLCAASSRGGRAWLSAENFARSPAHATREAMRCGGCALERWEWEWDHAAAEKRKLLRGQPSTTRPC